MEENPSLHVVASDPDRAERLAAALPRSPDAVHRELGALPAGSPEEPRVVVVDAGDLGDGVGLLALLRSVAERDARTTVVIPDEEGGEIRFRPLAAGFPVDGEGIETRLSEEEAEGAPFDLHEVVRFVARIRHDVNNPLTAGMAETQLLLMDLGEEGEVGESLLTIQRQLQRIQGLIQDLRRVRRPRAGTES